jgi:hypothetical protein
MIIYSASILFHAGNYSNGFPMTSTSQCNSGMDAFISRCVLAAQQNDYYCFSDTHINAMCFRLNENGTCSDKLQSKQVSFLNFDKEKLQEYLLKDLVHVSKS